MITDVSPRGCVINLGDATPDVVARGFIIMSVHYAPRRHVQIAYLVLTLMERSIVKTNKLFFFEGGLIPHAWYRSPSGTCTCQSEKIYVRNANVRKLRLILIKIKQARLKFTSLVHVKTVTALSIFTSFSTIWIPWPDIVQYPTGIKNQLWSLLLNFAGKTCGDSCTTYTK